jgi:hypothetical protein
MAEVKAAGGPHAAEDAFLFIHAKVALRATKTTRQFVRARKSFQSRFCSGGFQAGQVSVVARLKAAATKPVFALQARSKSRAITMRCISLVPS